MKDHKKLKKTVVIKANDKNKEKLSSFMHVLKAVAEDMGLEVADADVNALVGSDY